MMESLLLAVIAVYSVSIAVTLVRALLGPTLGDRVLAIDAATYMAVVLFALFSMYFREPKLAVSAVFLALWVYLLDLYVARYLEGDSGA